MSTELHSSNSSIALTRTWGGDTTHLQVTPDHERNGTGFIDVTPEEAFNLAEDLYAFADEAVTSNLDALVSEIQSKPGQESCESDGSTASYYELPEGATELQHLISHRDMNAQIGEIFRACYRYGQAPHSPKLRDAKKIKFYINAEIERLEKLEGKS